jgi:hypothetical protein
MPTIVKKLLGENEQTMTVAQLIQELQQFDPNTPVYFGHPSHDHWKTELAAPVLSVGMDHIKDSDYHSSKAVANRGRGNRRDMSSDEMGDDEPEEGSVEVVMLSRFRS